MKKNLLEKESRRLHDITQEQWDFAHLQLSHVPDHLKNPLMDLDPSLNTPAKQLLSVMMNPDYFGWTCTKLLNTGVSPNGLELLPIQCSILRELWYRPFPILIATRGFSKCVKWDTWVVCEDGFKRIGKLIGMNSPVLKKQLGIPKVLGENGFKEVEYGWNNGETKTIKCETRYGFSIENTLDHPMRVVRGSSIDWVKQEDLKIDDFVVIDRKKEWFPNVNDVQPDLAYAFGLLVGDGGYTLPGTIGFTTADKELAEKLSGIFLKYFGKPFKKLQSKYEYALYGVSIRKSLFEKYGFNSSVCGEKDFPESILSASQESVAAFIRGLMDTDGTINKKGTILGFCSKSENLARTLQFMLTRFGIISKVKPNFNVKYQTYYYNVYMCGKNIRLFHKEIGFGLKRKQEILEKVLLLKTNSNKDVIPSCLVRDRIINLKNLIPLNKKGQGLSRTLLPEPYYFSKYDLTYEKLGQILDIFNSLGLSSSEDYIFLKDLYKKNYFYDRVQKLESSSCQTFDVHIPDGHSFVSNGFISHNTFMLAVYSLLRALFIQGRKIIITGAGFRQSKLVLAYAEQIWWNSPILRDICGYASDKNQGPHHDTDVWWMQIGESKISALPIGTGEKIRGQRAHDIIADEFSSINQQIFEEVIAGFGVVNIDPISQVKHYQRMQYLQDVDAMPQGEEESNVVMPNQMILAGTASFAYNHFCAYWKKHKNIILSQGNIERLEQLGIDPNLDYRKYSIMRMPVHLLPRGFMDQAQIDRSKATLSVGIFENEFGAVFTDDSNGFYRRSILDKAMPSQSNPVIMPDGEEVTGFSALLKGDPNKKYIMAIDPASIRDNFAIVILEANETHARIVHCWTTNAQEHLELREAKVVLEKDFYEYTHRKIRDFMRLFNIIHIAIDSQGGGRTITELLHNENNILPGEHLIWEIDSSSPLWDGKERPTDVERGLHIVELVQFADAKYTSDANHGMKADFEQRLLLFPFYDDLESALIHASNEDADRTVDTLSNVYAEIDELRDELMMITHDQTPSGREHWGAPKVKGGAQIATMHDDRFSALVMANAAARRLRAIPLQREYFVGGGFVGQIPTAPKNMKPTQLYVGPAWFTENSRNVTTYGIAVQR